MKSNETLWELGREAEEATLGAILIKPDILEQPPINELSSKDFLTHRNGFVFQAILNLYEARRAIDQLTVAAELEHMGKLGDVGGHAYLTHLATHVESSLNAPDYARIVLEHTASARLAQAAGEILKLSGHSVNGGSRWAEAQGILNRFIESEPIPGMGLLTYPKLQALKWKDDPELVPDLIPTSGLAAISGDTGAGKTFLALDIHMAVAEAGACLGGRQVTKGGATLYLGIDNSTRTLQRRTRELADARGIDPVVEGFHLHQDPIDISKDAGAATLRRLIEETEAVMVTVDMFNRYTGRVDLHRMDEVGPPLMRLR